MTKQETLRSITLRPDVSIRDAARAIQESAVKIMLVCDEGGRLCGTVTDGDIRRAVLEDVDIHGAVETIMNRHPKVGRPGESRHELKQFMRRNVIRHLPCIDSEGRVVDLAILDEEEEIAEQEATVVLMAGGRGMRLMPLTKDIPKPLLKVGSKPLLERQVEQLTRQGFRRFIVSINYLGHMIEQHLGDGAHLGVSISYVREDRPLGTAGAVSLLDEGDRPLVVMNGDIVTRSDLANMLAAFRDSGVVATMGVREYLMTVPYGCVSLDGDHIAKVEEKPTFRHLISAGIYVLSAEACSHIPFNDYFDMPDLFSRLIDQGLPTNTFLITEEWIDIGRKDDLLWARKLFDAEDSDD